MHGRLDATKPGVGPPQVCQVLKSYQTMPVLLQNLPPSLEPQFPAGCTCRLSLSGSHALAMARSFPQVLDGLQ